MFGKTMEMSAGALMSAGEVNGEWVSAFHLVDRDGLRYRIADVVTTGTGWFVRLTLVKEGTGETLTPLLSAQSLCTVAY